MLAPTLGLLLAVLAAHVSGQDPTAIPKPGINDNFKNPDLKPEEWLGRFETESREVYAHRNQIVEASGVQPGWSVADIGAGTGLFTMLFADAVGDDGKEVFVKEIEDAGFKMLEGGADFLEENYLVRLRKK